MRLPCEPNSNADSGLAPCLIHHGSGPTANLSMLPSEAGHSSALDQICTWFTTRGCRGFLYGIDEEETTLLPVLPKSKVQ